MQWKRNNWHQMKSPITIFIALRNKQRHLYTVLQVKVCWTHNNKCYLFTIFHLVQNNIKTASHNNSHYESHCNVARCTLKLGSRWVLICSSLRFEKSLPLSGRLVYNSCIVTSTLELARSYANAWPWHIHAGGLPPCHPCSLPPQHSNIKYATNLD